MCRILAGHRRKGEKGGGKDWPKLCLFCQSPYLSRLGSGLLETRARRFWTDIFCLPTRDATSHIYYEWLL